MQTNNQLSLCLGALLVGGSVAAVAEEAPPVARVAEQPATPERAQTVVKELGTLLSASSAARQVEGSKAESVSSGAESAHQLHAQAQKALDAGHHAEAIRLASEGKKAFFSATRKAEPEQVLAEKRKRDYQTRLDSIQALSDALQRSGSEAGKDMKTALKDIKALTDEAAAAAAKGDYVQGRKLLDRAYVAAKLSIEALKQGTTAVAVKGTSPKDVFEYEAFRNETYQSLIQMIVDERKKAGIESDDFFLNDMAAAEALRKEGLALSEKKDFDGATAKLGESTSNYKRAVRRAGVQILD